MVKALTYKVVLQTPFHAKQLSFPTALTRRSCRISPDKHHNDDQSIVIQICVSCAWVFVVQLCYKLVASEVEVELFVWSFHVLLLSN